MPKLGQTSTNFLESLIGQTVKIRLLRDDDETTPISDPLVGFDEFTVIVKHKNKHTLIYKHSIESIWAS